MFGNPIPDTIPSHLVIAEDAFEEADRDVSDVLRPVAEKISAMVRNSSQVRLAPSGLIAWASQQNILQSEEAWDSVKDWVDTVNHGSASG